LGFDVQGKLRVACRQAILFQVKEARLPDHFEKTRPDLDWLGHAFMPDDLDSSSTRIQWQRLRRGGPLVAEKSCRRKGMHGFSVVNPTSAATPQSSKIERHIFFQCVRSRLSRRKSIERVVTFKQCNLARS